MGTSDLVQISTTLPAELAHQARVRAAIEGKSRSALVRELLIDALTSAQECGMGDTGEVHDEQ